MHDGIHLDEGIENLGSVEPRNLILQRCGWIIPRFEINRKINNGRENAVDGCRHDCWEILDEDCDEAIKVCSDGASEVELRKDDASPPVQELHRFWGLGV